MPVAADGYAPRCPEQILLHQIVREQLETFPTHARNRDHACPRFVEQELRSYLRCGVLAHGFLRLRCDDCRLDRLVPFSCKRRGFCPSCGGRRMSERWRSHREASEASLRRDTAAHLVDRVLPEVPVRQWVLTLPYPLRYRCAYDARLTSGVLRAFIRSLFAELRRRAKAKRGVGRGQCGAVTFIQRFGSALNLNVHFHTLALDGVYELVDGAPTRFVPLPPPDASEVARVLAGTARRISRVLEARAEGDEDALARDEPLLATLAAASLGTRIATGPQAGARWRRLGDRVEPSDDRHDPDASPRVPQHEGMSLHAEVAVSARDRRHLERLCRYVARPPLASDRLEECPDGRLALRLKTRWRDGTTHILMERRELLDRLVPLIPSPRAHQVRYYGALAPCSSVRDRIVPGPREEPSTSPPDEPSMPSLAITQTVPEAAGQIQATGRAGASDPAADAYGVPRATHRHDLTVVDEADRAAAASSPPNGRPRPRRLPWAELLQRVFEVDALRCPRSAQRRYRRFDGTDGDGRNEGCRRTGADG
ncbi:MAG: transposase [Deltaproteobacteria bacterium]|nr:transposase [Deltaproteobacteria bacterium]